jgi:hypothetical protein
MNRAGLDQGRHPMRFAVTASTMSGLLVVLFTAADRYALLMLPCTEVRMPPTTPGADFRAEGPGLLAATVPWGGSTGRSDVLLSVIFGLADMKDFRHGRPGRVENPGCDAADGRRDHCVDR